nr:BAT2 domain containing protein [Haemonchus contortus]
MRRMPPPATLPSLKSENNGQDQNVVVIMQGGAGWNKNETSTDPFEVIKPHSSCPTSALDLRPTWAKQTPSLTNSGSSGKGEFPTLFCFDTSVSSLPAYSHHSYYACLVADFRAQR